MRLGLDCSRFGSCFFFARKDIPCGVKIQMLYKILIKQLQFSLFLQHVTLIYVFTGFCQSTFSTFIYTFQRLNNKVSDQTAHLRRQVCAFVVDTLAGMRNVRNVLVNCRMIE